MLREKRPATRIRKTQGAKDDPWRTDTELVKQFVERRPDYQQLCNEIQYTLKKRLKGRVIEVSTVTGRAKTLNSFLEKIQRKTYNLPLEEVTDFAGVRVVCLYLEDLPKIEEIIRKEFGVCNSVDKSREKEIDQFGYGAVHFIVCLGQKSSGARYDDLRHLVCEIQVRTVMQDAWSIIQHHLVYKHESEVPQQLQRRLNSLAGLLETADDQFQRLRQERDAYIVSMKESISERDVFLNNDVNLDSVKEYLKWKFPDRPLDKFDGQLPMILSAVDRKKHSTLRDIDTEINATEEIRQKIPAQLDDLRLTAPSGVVPAAVELAWGLSITDKKFRHRRGMPHSWLKAIEELIDE